MGDLSQWGKSSMRKRTSKRVPVQLPVTFAGDLIDDGEGTVVNLSPEGCAIGCNSSPQRGNTIHLTVYLGDQELPMTVELANVRWRMEEVFGVQFISMSPEQQERLRRFINLFT